MKTMGNNIIKSWNKNALEWIKVIENADIESRKFTNKAILQLIGNSPAIKVLDVGCGEGWLTRSLGTMGKYAVGLDAIAQLLENAKKKRGRHLLPDVLRRHYFREPHPGSTL